MKWSMDDLYKECKRRSRNVELKSTFYKFHLELNILLNTLLNSGSKAVHASLAATKRTTVKLLPVCKDNKVSSKPASLFHHVEGESYNPGMQPCRLHPPTKEEARLYGHKTNGPNEPSAEATRYCNAKMYMGIYHMLRIQALILGDTLSVFHKSAFKMATKAINKSRDAQQKLRQKVEGKTRVGRDVDIDFEALAAIIAM